MIRCTVRRAVVFLGNFWPFSYLFKAYYVLASWLLARAIARVSGVSAIYDTSASRIPGVSDIDILVVLGALPNHQSSQAFTRIKRWHRSLRLLFPMLVDVRMIREADLNRWLQSKPELHASRKSWVLLSGHAASASPVPQETAESSLLRFQSAMYFYVSHFSKIHYSGNREEGRFEYVRVYNKIMRTLSSEGNTLRTYGHPGNELLARLILELDRESTRLLQNLEIGAGAAARCEDRYSVPVTASRYIDAVWSIPSGKTVLVVLRGGLGLEEIQQALDHAHYELSAYSRRGTVAVFTEVSFSAYLTIAKPFLQASLQGKSFDLCTENPKLFGHYLALLRRNLVETLAFSTAHDFRERQAAADEKAAAYSALLVRCEHLHPGFLPGNMESDLAVVPARREHDTKRVLDALDSLLENSIRTAGRAVDEYSVSAG